MKKIFTFLFVITNTVAANAQWTNTTNLFTDDQHMPVCVQTGDQFHGMVIKSFPDNGYFFIWEDKRLGFYERTQVFIQKFDKDGNRLWAINGVPVSAGTNSQQFTFSSNQDYRSRRVAASDNAGGLYITYTDDSIATYGWKRICVQHLTPTGNRVFSGPGYIVAQTPAGQSVNYGAPQLISDDEGGFYVSYVNTGNTYGDYVYIHNYKDENGTMKWYGGGRMNENAISRQLAGPCVGASRWELVYPGTTVIDYNIWPDLQGNCSVVINMNGNIGSQGNMLCYNKLWKAKKDQTINVTMIYPSGNPYTQTSTYKKGDVDVLYKLRWNFLDANCTSPAGYNVWTDFIVISQGFQLIDQGALSYNYPKGVTVATPGNINIELVACNKRDLINNVISDPPLFAIAFMDEKFDAIPYQRASNDNPLFGYNLAKPAGLDTFYYFRDSILAAGAAIYDFSLSSGGGHLYTSALVQEKAADNFRKVLLQHLSIENAGAGQYHFKYETGSKKGEVIGSEIRTGFGGSSIGYDFPLVTANNTGNALFHIVEEGRYTRVSPILQNAQLAWGAMGKPISSPIINNLYVYPGQAFASVDPTDGTGVISWTDGRNGGTGTSTDVFMRHLDQLNVAGYLPPAKAVQALVNGTNFANPVFLSGSSKKFSTIEAGNATTGAYSPVVEIEDNYNLGAVPTGIYENTGAIRTTNGKPYLNRNYTINPQNNPNGSASIHVRLFFTTTQFNALKAADPAITDPGSLSVIKQTNNTNTVPVEYSPAAGDVEIMPTAWQAVNGGYYLEIVVTSFSNFFIQKAVAALPVTWLGIQAQYTDAKNVRIHWQVADEQNVKEYSVQQSDDGMHFTTACTVAATGANDYQCTVPVSNAALHYYRVLQVDNDSKFTYSKIVSLRSSPSNPTIVIYPNPAADKLYIQGLASQSLLQVHDVKGNIVQQQTVATASQPINIGRLAAGIYLLRIYKDGKQQTIKFVKQ